MPKADPATLRYIFQRYNEGYFDDDQEEVTDHAGSDAAQETQTKES